MTSNDLVFVVTFCVYLYRQKIIISMAKPITNLPERCLYFIKNCYIWACVTPKKEFYWTNINEKVLRSEIFMKSHTIIFALWPLTLDLTLLVTAKLPESNITSIPKWYIWCILPISQMGLKGLLQQYYLKQTSHPC